MNHWWQLWLQIKRKRLTNFTQKKTESHGQNVSQGKLIRQNQIYYEEFQTLFLLLGNSGGAIWTTLCLKLMTVKRLSPQNPLRFKNRWYDLMHEAVHFITTRDSVNDECVSTWENKWVSDYAWVSKWMNASVYILVSVWRSQWVKCVHTTSSRIKQIENDEKCRWPKAYRVAWNTSNVTASCSCKPKPLNSAF